MPEDKTRPEDRTQRLFLEQATWWEYDSPDDRPSQAARAGTSYFDPDGSAYNVRNIGNGREVMESPPMEPTQAQQFLYEPHPTFGDWTSITRRDRDAPTT